MLEIYIIRIISNIKFKKLVRKQLEILHMQQIFSVYFNLKSYWLSNSIDKSNCERKEAQVVNLIERRQNCNLYKYLKKMVAYRMIDPCNLTLERLKQYLRCLSRQNKVQNSNGVLFLSLW